MPKNLLELYNLKYIPLGVLNDESYGSAKNIQESHRINTVSTLTFELPKASEKWDMIINEALVKWKGEFYVIKNTTYVHDDMGAKVTVECKHLSCSLEGYVNQIVDEIGKTPTDLMKSVLGYRKDGSGNYVDDTTETGWKVGKVTVDSTKMRSLQSTDNSVFSNLIRIADLYNGILRFNSASKTVDLLSDPVDRNLYPNRKIEIRKGKNLKSVNLVYDSSELATRMYVYGGDADDGSGAISIIEHNPTHKSYLEDYSYYTGMGYTTADFEANPELFYKELYWNASDYHDSLALYNDAVDKMAIVSKPKVSCSFTGLDLSIFPEYFMEQPYVGEEIYIIDEDLKINIKAQVVSYSQNSETPWEMNVEITNAIEYDSVLRSLMDTNKKVNKAITPLNETRAGEIKGVIDIAKANLLSTNSSWYTDPTDGSMVFENLEKTKAMKLGGGVFAISNKKVNGSYVWTSFGDGDGFIASRIIAGILQGAMVKWDLDNGTFLIGNSPTDYKLFFDGTTLHLNTTVSYSNLDEETQDMLNNGDSAYSSLLDMADDNKLTPLEKQRTLQEWNIIVAEKADLNTQATLFNITTENTNYNTAFQNLANYLNGGTTWSAGLPSWLSNISTTTNIAGSTFRSKFEDYNTKKMALLNAISAKAKALADTAQSTANTAKTNASNAQAVADEAKSKAESAQSTANSAVSSANTANSLLADLSNDNKLTPSEKQSTKMEWEIIASEKANIEAQATTYSITTEKATYTSAFQNLANYLNGGTAWSSGTPSLLSDLTVSSDIVGSTFRDKFKAYYDAKTALLKLIAEKAKTLADNAQSTANTANTNAQTAQSSADNALNALSDMSNDNKLTPTEKLNLKTQWDSIVAEKAIIDAQLDVYALTTQKTALNTDYTALNNALITPLANLTTTSDVDGSNLRTLFANYYEERASAYKAISDSAKSKADTAQSTANSAQSTADIANSTANAVKSKTDGWTYAGRTTINGASIEAYSMTFDKAKGGELKLGGSGTNGGANGFIGVYDANDVQKVLINNEGIKLSNGAKLISDSGVLTTLMYTNNGIRYGGFDMVGRWVGSTGNENRQVTVSGFIPANFTIVSATLYVNIMSRYFVEYMDDNGVIYNGYKSTKNVRVQKSSTAIKGYEYHNGTTFEERFDMSTAGNTDITTAVWGATPWSPTAGDTIQTKTADVKSHLTSGQQFRFIVDSSSTDTSLNNTGLARLDLVVIGYQS